MTSDARELAARLDRIHRLIDEYLRVKTQSNQVRRLWDRIRRGLDAARTPLAYPKPAARD